jgi:hypothetical protein
MVGAEVAVAVATLCLRNTGGVAELISVQALTSTALGCIGAM